MTEVEYLLCYNCGGVEPENCPDCGGKGSIRLTPEDKAELEGDRRFDDDRDLELERNM